MKLRKDIPTPTHETAEEWWESLGYCWDGDDGTQIQHPICGWDELDGYQPKSQLEEKAYAAALQYRLEAIAIEGEFQAAIAAWQAGDLDACFSALSDAESIEQQHGDAPGTRALSAQLLQESEPPSADEIATLITEDGWDTDLEDWTDYLTARGKLEGWGPFDARELAEAVIAAATPDDTQGGAA